jgi:cytochrome P450
MSAGAAARTPAALPTPPVGLGFWRLPVFRKNPLGTLERVWRERGDVVCLWSAPLEMNLVVHPDDVQHVLLDASKNYDKNAVGYRKLRLALGEGLLMAEGDFWLRQRRIMQPAFHRTRLERFGTIITDLTRQALDVWPAGAKVDVSDAMTRLTLEIVGSAMFSTDLSGDAARLRDYMMVAIRYINARMMSLTAMFDFPERLPTRENRRFREALRGGEALILELIAARRRGERVHEDFLTMLMEVRDADTGEGMTDRQLRDEAITIFAAGHETTANALAWLFYLVAKHPEAAARLRAEVDGVLGGRVPTVADLPRLEYTTMAIKEAMRLYPPAWAMSRRVLNDDVIGGYRVSAGSAVLLCPYLTHRHPAFWPDPERFDPERFAPANSKGRHRYAYFPFGGGPRFCIGSGFAMMEAQLVAAMVLQRYELALDPAHPVEMEPLVTLHAKGGVRLMARQRP